MWCPRYSRCSLLLAAPCRCTMARWALQGSTRQPASHAPLPAPLLLQGGPPANTQPAAHMSTAKVYRLAPKSSSGARYQRTNTCSSTGASGCTLGRGLRNTCGGDHPPAASQHSIITRYIKSSMIQSYGMYKLRGTCSSTPSRHYTRATQQRCMPLSLYLCHHASTPLPASPPHPPGWCTWAPGC